MKGHINHALILRLCSVKKKAKFGSKVIDLCPSQIQSVDTVLYDLHTAYSL